MRYLHTCKYCQALLWVRDDSGENCFCGMPVPTKKTVTKIKRAFKINLMPQILYGKLRSKMIIDHLNKLFREAEILIETEEEAKKLMNRMKSYESVYRAGITNLTIISNSLVIDIFVYIDNMFQ